MSGSRASRLAGGFFATIAAAGIVVVTGACSGTPDTTQVTDIFTTDNAFEQFVGRNGNTQNGPGVEGFLEARCGSLDCHGQVGRPLRIFSQNGLRLVDDAGNVSGGGATTQDEMFANYVAAIGVQPELTSRVFAQQADPASMLLVRKPLQAERHKGGQIIVSGDQGYNCLLGWLSGVMDFDACKGAANVP